MNPSQVEPSTKDILFDASQKLMLEKGFVATSVDEICELAGVTKGSFFYYFKSKEELGKDLLQRFSMQKGKIVMEKVVREGSDPRKRVYAFVDAAMEMGSCCEDKGCLIGTFTQELSESHPELRRCCDEIFTQLRKLFEAELKAAQKQFARDKKIDIQGLAEEYIALTQGSLLLIKATQDHSLMARTLGHFKNYLQQIFGK